MKKLLLSAAMVAFGLSVNAQEFQFGAKAGGNFANVGGEGAEDLSMRTAFHVGGVAEIKFNDKFSLQPELLYSAQGAKSESSYEDFGMTVKEETKLNLDYLNVPIMGKYYLMEGFSVEAGPQIGMLLSAKADIEASAGGESVSEEYDLKDEMSTIDFGVNFGLGYKLDNGLAFGARYNLGLSNINDFEGSDDFKNNNGVIQASVGYMF
ncbi:porin family protein [Mangrovimonas aestuarii]|uniref:porin family protein n=1 Tax=Mangrovimonas aestuarii TaxID=3018443 RepID=UPI002378E204|nr:porin family protein [Mangrovimonas aestuarii]